jgi:hypothetical protein
MKGKRFIGFGVFLFFGLFTACDVNPEYDGGGNGNGFTRGTAITLAEGLWSNGAITASHNEQWFKFTATASTQYIHAGFGTLTDLYVQLYNSTGSTLGDRANLYGSAKYASRNVVRGQVYYIKVTPYSSSNSGTYMIGITASASSPNENTTMASAPALTNNVWTNGYISPSNKEQWFKFTATASTQYIYAGFGTLDDLYVQLYDSTGSTLGSQKNLYGGTRDASFMVTYGRVYYIRITPYYSYDSGTYQIKLTS